MTLRLAKTSACLATGLAFLYLSISGSAQTPISSSPVTDPSKVETAAASSAPVPVAELPEAPTPQQAPAAAPAQADTASSASQAGPDAPQTPQKTQQQLAAEQVAQQKKQRVLGIVPNFNTSYVYGAASLSTGQKFDLAFHSQIDPVAFGTAGFVALISQAEGSHYGYGGGWGGYAKRYGQTYTDNFDGQMLGNALLPSLLHQDPRYFRLGRGTVKHRILYALGTNVIARHDNTGKWEPNYSNVIGNFAAGGISNLYLPQDERGFSSTITGGLVVIAEGGLGSMFQEFWPDISRHFLHKDPTGGQDAINRMKPDPTGGKLFSNHHDTPPASPATTPAPQHDVPQN
jgi:hypothetical protein